MDKDYTSDYNNYDNYDNYDNYNETEYQGQPNVPEYFLTMFIFMGCSLSSYRLCSHIANECMRSIKKYKCLKSVIITSDDEENLLNECSICLEQYKKKEKIINLSCHHTFHAECIKEWLNKDNNTCPQCREIII